MKKLLLALLLSACAGPAQSQSVQQSGNVTPGHVASWITNGIVGDGGAPGGPIFTGSTTVNDFACAGASGTIIDCGLSAVGANAWTGLQNFNGGATAPTRNAGDSTTNVATTAFVANAIVGVYPVIPVTHPSSGNLSGTGCATAHQIWWVDQNLCSNADVWQITSSDPSAAFTLTLSGSVTTGDAISLTITMGSGNCSGAGCTVTTGAAVGGDTLSTLAGKLACAIANSASLFNLNGGSCAGGVITAPVSGGYGGYANGNPVGYVVISGTGIAFDFNSNISLKVTSAVSGAATETVTINNTTCGTRCSYSLDNNPAFQMVRNSGGAPQPGSVLNAVYSIGSTSACPTSPCINYGVFANWVANSTAGSLQSAWLLQTPNTAGTLSGGTWFGQGVFSNSGGSPFSTTAVQDKGVGTFNAGSCYWLNSTPARDLAGNQDSICQGAGQFQITATGADTMILSSSAGLGINITPTGSTFVSALGAFISGTQVPTTGSGIGLTGGAAPVITAENYGTSTLLPLSLKTSSGTATVAKAPTFQVFIVGTNLTYTTPTNPSPVWLEIELVGGGGGGAGSGTTPGAAGAGGNTCWNTSGTACTSPVYQGIGGALGSTGTSAAGGGVAGSASCLDSQTGGTGGAASGATSMIGGTGGSSRYGGAGPGGAAASGGGLAAIGNTGSGGGGAGDGGTANTGGGGGAGGWCYAIISAPAATYTYTVGAAGAAGTAGGSGFAGGLGGVGKIRVVEHYN